MAQQQARDEAGNIWEIDAQGNPVRLVQAAQSQAPRGQVFTLPQDPTKQAQAQANLAAAQAQAQRATAEAPYAASIAQAQAEKARADAEKARRDLSAQQATASPAQQKAMADLGNDEVLSAIQKAREDINGGGSAGYWARLKDIPVLGNLVAPQGVVNLEASLNTIASRLTLDKLAQLKQASPTGASGLGSLTEKEGSLLRDSVSALGQTQDPQRLLQNLAEVERHYRNVLALSNGEDYRDPKIAEKYGIAAQPGGEINPSLDPNAKTREEVDPALQGVNARVRGMVGAGRSTQDIVGYLNGIRPGLGDGVSQQIDATVKFRAQNPKVPLDRYVVSLDKRQVPLTASQQALNSFAQSPVGTAIMAAGNAVTGFNLPRFTDNPGLTQASLDATQANNPVSGALGTLAGGALAGAGIEGALPARLGRFAAPAADIVYGGVSGIGTGQGALTGAAEGLAGGVLGRGSVRGLGAGLRGVTNPDVQYLRSQGVPMTVGQMAGGAMKAREDRLSGFGGVGDRINALRRGGIEGFNAAGFRQGLEPIGQQGVNNLGEAGIDEARNLVSGAYNQALSGVNVAPDAQFIQEARAAIGRGSNVARTGPEFRSYMDQRVGPLFGQTGQLTGRQIQDAMQGVRSADFGTDSMGQMATDAVNQFGDALTGLVNRQAPDVMPGLNSANSAYRNTNILADAVGKGMNTDGLFTPAQLGQAARTNAKKYQGMMGSASQARPFYDLQRAGQNVLPSKIPDSGTAGRQEAGSMLGAVKGAARNALYAPLYADSTQAALQRLMLDRPDVVRQLGQSFQNQARLGGLFGRPIAIMAGSGGY